MRTKTRITGKRWGLLALICLALLLAGAYLGGRWLETRNSRPEPRGDHIRENLLRSVRRSSKKTG